jgi:hypothetical protein
MIDSPWFVHSAFAVAVIFSLDFHRVLSFFLLHHCQVIGKSVSMCTPLRSPFSLFFLTSFPLDLFL